MADPSAVQALPPSDWDGSLAPVLDAMNGRPLNVHGLIANHPALLEAWWDLRMHVVKASELDARAAELVILRTAVHAASQYEWLSHVDRGHAAGLTLEEIERVMEGPAAEGWSENDELLLQAVSAISRARSSAKAASGSSSCPIKWYP